MGRIILFALVVLALVLVWKAFGPQSWKRPAEPQIKGPDDDPDFLWELDKKRFKEQQRKRREEGAGGRGSGEWEHPENSGGSLRDRPEDGEDSEENGVV